ncbi:hypothetical protein ACP4OV_013490 [Aristida adscensionis]
MRWVHFTPDCVIFEPGILVDDAIGALEQLKRGFRWPRVVRLGRKGGALKGKVVVVVEAEPEMGEQPSLRQDVDNDDDYYEAEYNGASALELERRLHELLQERNRERIEELEATLRRRNWRCACGRTRQEKESL